jgi:hypothetical protein
VLVLLITSHSSATCFENVCSVKNGQQEIHKTQTTQTQQLIHKKKRKRQQFSLWDAAAN